MTSPAAYCGSPPRWDLTAATPGSGVNRDKGILSLRGDIAGAAKKAQNSYRLQLLALSSLQRLVGLLCHQGRSHQGLRRVNIFLRMGQSKHPTRALPKMRLRDAQERAREPGG
jgi:hypothetical protein